MKSFAFRLAELALWHWGGGKRRAHGSVSILMMHGVHDARMAARVSAPSNSLPLAAFSAGVESLQKRYRIISLDAAAEMLAGRAAWQPGCAVLTFDDSLKCLLPTAAHWLSSRGLNATFYLSTEVIEQRRPYWWKRLEYTAANGRPGHAEVVLPGGGSFRVNAPAQISALRELKASLKRLRSDEIERTVHAIEQQLGAALTLSDEVDPCANILTWEDAREMISLGMTIGSHSVTHPNLTLLSPQELRRELEQSKQIIENRTGAPCRHFCYPYGAVTDAVSAAAATAGYLTAVTTETPGWNEVGRALLRLRRFAMPSQSSRVRPLLAGLGVPCRS